MDVDHRLSLELFKKAAELGDAEAHGQMGLRYAMGLARPECMEGASIRHFDQVRARRRPCCLAQWLKTIPILLPASPARPCVLPSLAQQTPLLIANPGISRPCCAQPDDQRALLHYHFGAAGGDALSRMALAYRHGAGQGVPKSCWAAAAHYQPVAEEVLARAVTDGGVPQVGAIAGRLVHPSGTWYVGSAVRCVADVMRAPGLPVHPQVERIRLNLHAKIGLRAERSREVLQYYRTSADNGNVDAQVAVGKVGPHRERSGAPGATCWPSRVADHPTTCAGHSCKNRLHPLRPMCLQVLHVGSHGTRDPLAARHYLRAAADAGDADAMAQLGERHY